MSAVVSPHAWLQPIRATFLPVFTTPFLARVEVELGSAITRLGGAVQDVPDDSTDLILAAAPFGAPLSWRKAPFFQARRHYRLARQPVVFTVMHAPSGLFAETMDRLERALAKEPPDPADFAFPGLQATAYLTLVEQGRRGGPILALQRLLQAQAMCLRILLMVGDDRPETTYHFDLVGACARTIGDTPAAYQDLAVRMATAATVQNLGGYVVLPDPIPQPIWQRLFTPRAMSQASAALGARGFFTDMVRISDLVQVPALSGAIAEQYSEGCLGTWEPGLSALVSSITGSARPVDKGNITDDDLAVVVRVGEDGRSVYVREVEGKRNDPPSSEAFEMVDIDSALPWITLDAQWGVTAQVPVARSKLHGHRGVTAYDPRQVEFVAMDPVYSHYPVSCGTTAQAHGIKNAFARSEALQNPGDPRQLVFTILPTHGVFIVEKWAPGKAPFQLIWEAFDAGTLQISSLVPQGPDLYWPQQLV